MSRGDKGTVLCLLCHLFILRAGRDDTGKSDSRRLRVQEVPCRRSAQSSGSVFRLPMEAHPAGGTAAHGRAEERKWNCPERTQRRRALSGVSLHRTVCKKRRQRTAPCLLRHLKLVEADFFVDFAEGLSGDVGSFLRTGLVDAVQVSLVPP